LVNDEAMSAAISTALRELCDDPGSCREWLPHAAGLLHAERGLDAVSTRELTSAAGANLAAFAYYFGGKDGLEQAVIAHVIDCSRERMGPIFARLGEEMAAAGEDRRRLARATAAFVGDYLHASLPIGPENWVLTVVMRAMSERSDAHDRLYEALFAPMLGTMHALAAAATGRDRDDLETRILATATFGEMWTFRHNRAVLPRDLGWDDFTRAQIDQAAGWCPGGFCPDWACHSMNSELPWSVRTRTRKRAIGCDKHENDRFPFNIRRSGGPSPMSLFVNAQTETVRCRRWGPSTASKPALAPPKEVEHWSRTTPREKLIKIGTKVVRHGPLPPAPVDDGMYGANALRATIVGSWREPCGHSRSIPFYHRISLFL
jgi:AcrR family transcriptional regulator